MEANHLVRILLVDDHPLVRDGLKSRLLSQSNWEVCGEAESPREAIRLVRERCPDLVVVDLSLKSGNGLELIKQLSSFSVPPKMLVCSMHDENLYAQRAIQAGASGFLHKQQASDSLVRAIQRILDGKIYVSEQVTDHVLSRMTSDSQGRIKNPIEQLTDRELEVFEGIGNGLTIQRLADSLHLSVKTVETYRDRAKRKFRVRTSAELMRYAVKWVSEQTGG